MLLTPAPSIHTAFMRFPIDALFLDRNLRVVDIVERLGPWRVASKRRARSVLELAAGECARRKVEVGDRLELRERKPVALVASDAADMAHVFTFDSGKASVARRHGGNLARLAPLRVLVLSPDHQFRSVMSLLLARRNCSVTSITNAARVGEIALRENPDVVVIDVGELAAGAAVATVEALGTPVGVVLVADDARPELCGSAVVAKWGPFGDLVAAIERADEQRQSWGGNGDRR
jgi:hypothetical protein